MKLMKTSSRWGNLYRFSYYIDGKRVSKSEFERVWEQMTSSQKDEAYRPERTDYGFRDSWEF